MLAFLLPPGQPAYFLAGVGGNLIPYPVGSQGILCVTGAAARYNGPGELVFVGASGVAATLADGVAMAEDALASGLAAQKLSEFIDFTQLMRQEA